MGNPLRKFKFFPVFFTIQINGSVISMRRDKPKSCIASNQDESAQLSIDFLIGFSIFMITLITAATMTSGLLIGLQSKHIDYDAVAYRTGVILVEDPGEPSLVFNYTGKIEEIQLWEYINKQMQKKNITRIGMSSYKSIPRIVSEKKFESFSNTTFFSLNDYRERIIFGDYPYHFNITIQKLKDSSPCFYVGEPYFPSFQYGYSRRLILIKEYNQITIDLNNYPHYLYEGESYFNIIIDTRQLITSTRGPIYSVDPLRENLRLNFTNVSAIANGTPVNLSLTNCSILGGAAYVPIDGKSIKISADGNKSGISMKNISSFITTESSAGYFIPIGASVSFPQILINYTFEDATTNISERVRLSSLPEGSSIPILTPAVMEVRIW